MCLQNVWDRHPDIQLQDLHAFARARGVGPRAGAGQARQRGAGAKRTYAQHAGTDFNDGMHGQYGAFGGGDAFGAMQPAQARKRQAARAPAEAPARGMQEHAGDDALGAGLMAVDGTAAEQYAAGSGLGGGAGMHVGTGAERWSADGRRSDSGTGGGGDVGAACLQPGMAGPEAGGSDTHGGAWEPEMPAWLQPDAVMDQGGGSGPCKVCA